MTALLRAQTAEACSPPNFVVPTFGATNVPTNLVEVLSGNPYGDSRPYLRKAGTDTPIVLEETIEWGLRRMRLASLLEPNTTYEVVWYGDVYSSFTTGDGRDDVAPSALTVDNFQIAHAMREPETSCGGVAIEVGAELSGIGTEPLLRVRVTGDGQVQERLVPDLSLLGYPLSHLELDVVPGKTYDVEIWTRDYAGNEGPIARFDGVKVRACASITPSYTGSLFDCPLDVTTLPEPEEDAGCSAGGGAGGAAGIVGLLAMFRQRRRRGVRR